MFHKQFGPSVLMTTCLSSLSMCLATVTFYSGFPPIVVGVKNPLMKKSPRLIR